MKMKLAAAALFVITGIIIFWQCSDMISPLRRAGAGPTVMVFLWFPTLMLMAAGLGALADVRGASLIAGGCLLPIIGFYAMTLPYVQSFSPVRHWSYLVALSAIAASLIFILRQITRKPHAEPTASPNGGSAGASGIRESGRGRHR